MSIDPATANYILKGIRTGKTIGTVGGAVAGGLLGGLPHNIRSKDGDIVGQRSTKERVKSGLINAAVMGYTGRQMGGLIGGIRNAHKWIRNGPIGGAGSYRSNFSSSGSQPTKPDWLKNAKNKAEAKAAWRLKARQTHPDFGGNARDFASAESAWRIHEPFFKEAMLLAFAEELEKMAFVGSALGGMAGYHMAPNTTKGKVIGTLVGAGAGHLAEGLGGLAKRKLVDEPHAREQRELYGYQPYAQAQTAQNWY